MERREFEQRLIEQIADEIAEIATERFKSELAGGTAPVFDIQGGGAVKLVAIDHYDLGGLLITVETADGRGYLVRLEIQSGHTAFEAVALDDFS